MAVAMRYILNTVGPNAMAVAAPSCAAIICGMQPCSSLKIPVFETTLESSAAAASGIRRALNAKGKHDTTVIVFAGDGGTYDIGFQALSSAVERNEDMIYFCMDNEGYMNTGGQKSSATPLYASTGSTPAGKGSRVITVLIPCLPGWGLGDDEAIASARLAVDSGMFPLYEVEDGHRYTLNQTTKTRRVKDYLQAQKRYGHLIDEELEEIQASVDKNWAYLMQRSAASKPGNRAN
jgi:pyruvate ferredoxin oxidoreductase beta subunit/2-oxoisovalerate ferredoxin oxidoreductase beta subunit